MAEYTEDQLDDMTDEELEAAANEARHSEAQEEDNADDENISDNEPENVDDGEEEPIVEDDEGETEPDDEVEVEETETSENEEDNLDGESDPKEDDKEEEATDTPDQQEFIPLKVSGKEIPINSLDELYTLASGGAAVTQKFQEIAAHKKSISIMQQHGLTEADLSLLIEARNGSKDALASLVKQSGIDSIDVTDQVAEGYQPGKFIPSDQQVSLDDVQREIAMDPEYNITQNVVNNVMDERSQNMLVQNPNMIRGLHHDIKSGAYQEVSAHAEKLKLMDGGLKSDMEYYIQAAQEGPSGQQPQQQIPAQPAPEPQPRKRVVSKDKRKAAGGSNRNKVQTPSVQDVNSMTDEELMAYREKIMERY